MANSAFIVRATATLTTAMLLYGLYLVLLWAGYHNVAQGDRPWPMGAAVGWFVALGLAGVWLVRRQTVVPWVWNGFLAWMTGDLAWAWWLGLLRVRGRHGCEICDDSQMSLWFATIVWLLVAIVARVFNRLNNRPH